MLFNNRGLKTRRKNNKMVYVKYRISPIKYERPFKTLKRLKRERYINCVLGWFRMEERLFCSNYQISPDFVYMNEKMFKLINSGYYKQDKLFGTYEIRIKDTVPDETCLFDVDEHKRMYKQKCYEVKIKGSFKDFFIHDEN